MTVETQAPVWTQIDVDGTRHEHFHSRPFRGGRQGSWVILVVADGDTDLWTCESGDITSALHEVDEHYLRDGIPARISVFGRVRLIDLM